MTIAGVENRFRRTGFFDLDGCVVDVKPLVSEFLDFYKHRVAVYFAVGHNNVAAHGQNT